MSKITQGGFKFGTFFSNLLMENNFTITKLAKETEISEVTFYRYKNNTQFPRRSHWKLVIEAIAKTVSEDRKADFLKTNNAIYDSIRQTKMGE